MQYPKRQELTIKTAAKNKSSALKPCLAVLADRFKSGEFTLPVLPQVASQVLTLTNNPDADIGDLSGLIHKDQALAGHVLKIANSPAYGGSETIVSLKQAVTRIGMRLLSDIAIAISMQGAVFQVPAFEKEVKNLWRHALASAAYGKEVALANRCNVEGQFLCGLLHAIGKPVVLQTIAEIQAVMDFSLNWASIQQLLDRFHCKVGVAVALKWKLPRQVTVSIEHYRDYALAPAFREETAMTYLADRLAIRALDPSACSDDELVADPVFAELNFYPDDIEQLLQKRDDVLSLVSSLEL